VKPSIEHASPPRTKLRRESELPRLAKFRALTAEPKRPKERNESELPIAK
jgi:hypothetical protein